MNITRLLTSLIPVTNVFCCQPQSPFLVSWAAKRQVSYSFSKLPLFSKNLTWYLSNDFLEDSELSHYTETSPKKAKEEREIMQTFKNYMMLI